MIPLHVREQLPPVPMGAQKLPLHLGAQPKHPQVRAQQPPLVVAPHVVTVSSPARPASVPATVAGGGETEEQPLPPQRDP